MPLILPRYGPGLSPMVSPFSREGYNAAGGGMVGNPGFSTAGLASSGANRAFYTPIELPVSGLARKLFWLNGSTVGTHNIQCGVYADAGDKPGAALIRGTSTLSAGASVLQYDDITDSQLPAALLWLAIWFSGTTPTVQGTSATFNRMNKGFMESSLVSGLPATATPVVNSGGVLIFDHGIQFRSSP